MDLEIVKFIATFFLLIISPSHLTRKAFYTSIHACNLALQLYHFKFIHLSLTSVIRMYIFSKRSPGRTCKVVLISLPISIKKSNKNPPFGACLFSWLLSPLTDHTHIMVKQPKSLHSKVSVSASKKPQCSYWSQRSGRDDVGRKTYSRHAKSLSNILEENR